MEAVRQAAGLELPFGWEDVWLGVALGVGGAIMAMLGAVAPLGYVRYVGVAVAVLAVAAILVLRVRFRRGTGRSTMRRREYSLGIAGALVTGLLAAGYLAWARSVGVSSQVVGSVAVSFTGAMCAVLALTSPGRRCVFPAAGALLVFGLVLPLCTPRQVIIGAGVSMAIAGLAGAAIQACQLRAQEADHEPATH
ncbi:MAG TPA: hypothetical protein VGY53_04555 [Isosphaeraceae bacterium]|nr:hypothetical protein [Isosphaeraceae bacterium]